MSKVELGVIVTSGAPFQVPPTQVNAPSMTVEPTRLPTFCQVLVPVTVPLRLKLPLDRTVSP